MDTRMIDVAIGLALVFALTSLLTTTVQEVYSSWKGLRGKVLRQAIESFVGDDKTFAAALLDHPLLVSLSAQAQKDPNRRGPSYAGADAVVTALIGHLVQTHAGGVRPATPQQLVDAVQGVATGAIRAGGALAPAQGGALMAGAAAALPNVQFARGLSTLAIGVERDWPAFEARLSAWYDAIGTRSTGWFKRKTQVGVFVIGLVTAGVVNINPIVVGSRLWQDEPLRKAVVKAAENASATYSAQQAGGATAGAPVAPPKATEAAPSSAARGVAVPQAPAPASSPAPAPQATAALAAAHEALMAGLDKAVTAAARAPAERKALVAVATRALAFERQLAAWKAAGAPTAGEAAARLQSLAAAIPAALPPAPAQPELRDGAQRVLAATAAATTAAPVNVAPLKVAESAASAPKPAAAAASAARYAVCLRPGTDASMRQLCQQLQDLGALQQAGLPIGWSSAALPSVFDDGCAAEGQCEGFSWLGNWRLWMNILLMPLGWIVTALACTLGAPFWFDALAKLVKLRGSGGKIDGAGGGGGGDKPAAPPPTMLARSPGPPGAAPGPAGDGAVAMSDALNDAERALTMAEVQRVQRGLQLPEIEVTGFFDGNTRRAIKAWQTQRGLLPAEGELSAAQLQELLAMRVAGTGGADDGAVG